MKSWQRLGQTSILTAADQQNWKWRGSKVDLLIGDFATLIWPQNGICYGFLSREHRIWLWSNTLPLPSTFLYSKSPRARDTASDPLTLWIITDPPAFWIRSSSGGFEGLWSCVTRRGLEPSPLSTPRESPQFEKSMYLSVIRTQMAVVPLLSSPLATSGIFLQCKQIAAK